MNSKHGRFGMNAGFNGPHVIPMFGPYPHGAPPPGMVYPGYAPTEAYRPRSWHMRPAGGYNPLANLVNLFNRLRDAYTRITRDLAYTGSIEGKLYSLPSDVKFHDVYIDSINDMLLSIDIESLQLNDARRLWCKLERVRTIVDLLYSSQDEESPSVASKTTDLSGHIRNGIIDCNFVAGARLLQSVVRGRDRSSSPTTLLNRIREIHALLTGLSTFTWAYQNRSTWMTELNEWYSTFSNVDEFAVRLEDNLRVIARSISTERAFEELTTGQQMQFVFSLVIQCLEMGECSLPDGYDVVGSLVDDYAQTSEGKSVSDYCIWPKELLVEMLSTDFMWSEVDLMDIYGELKTRVEGMNVQSPTEVAQEEPKVDPFMRNNAVVLMALYQDASARYNSVFEYSNEPSKYQPLTKDEYLHYVKTAHAAAPVETVVESLWTAFSESTFQYRTAYDLELLLIGIVYIVRQAIGSPAAATDTK